MSHQSLRGVAVVCVLVTCGDGIESTASTPPSIALERYVSAGVVGARVDVHVDVRGIGNGPAVEWRSLTPNAIAVESVSHGGRAAMLRVDERRTTYVIVTAKGTRVLVDTLFVSIPAI